MKIIRALLVLTCMVFTSTSAGHTTHVDYAKHIKKGVGFTVTFNNACPYDYGWKGSYDQMGSIYCANGKKYTGVFISTTKEWVVEGYHEKEKLVLTYKYKNADPNKNLLSIWGRVFSYDKYGRVIDPDYGYVGQLTLK